RPTRRGISIGGLDQSQLPNIPGKCSLAGLESPTGKKALKFFLTLDRTPVQKLENCALSGCFAHREYLFNSMNKYAYKIPFLSIRYFRNYLDAKLFPAQGDPERRCQARLRARWRHNNS